jgi:hypothetical protein
MSLWVKYGLYTISLKLLCSYAIDWKPTIVISLEPERLCSVRCFLRNRLMCDGLALDPCCLISNFLKCLKLRISLSLPRFDVFSFFMCYPLVGF